MGVFGQGFIKALLGEIREEHRGKIELRIGALPQQEARQALLAAGTDDELRVRNPGGVEIVGEARLSEAVRVSGTCLLYTSPSPRDTR